MNINGVFWDELQGMADVVANIGQASFIQKQPLDSFRFSFVLLCFTNLVFWRVLCSDLLFSYFYFESTSLIYHSS